MTSHQRSICSIAATALLTTALIGPNTALGAQKTKYSTEQTRFYDPPPDRKTCFWQVPAYKDVELLGPEKAKGIVLYSHGQAGAKTPSWTWPPASLIRLHFADAGYDVIKVQRNKPCEGYWKDMAGKTIGDFVSRIQEAKDQGYRTIIAAGASVGAAVALEASGKTPHIDAVLAIALSHQRFFCRNKKTFRKPMIRFHKKAMRTAIKNSKTKRIMITLLTNDHCIGHSFTPTVTKALAAKKRISHLYFDESTPRFKGHLAASSRPFPDAYGGCIRAFATDENIAPGRHRCEPPQPAEIDPEMAASEAFKTYAGTWSGQWITKRSPKRKWQTSLEIETVNADGIAGGIFTFDDDQGRMNNFNEPIVEGVLRIGKRLTFTWNDDGAVSGTYTSRRGQISQTTLKRTPAE